MLARLYELGRIHNGGIHQHAMIGQMYKAVVEAISQNGSWDLAWPLLGMVDPLEVTRPLTYSGERVALAASAKEKKLLREAVAGGRAQVDKEGKVKAKTGAGAPMPEQ